jgi:hypothetical protein
VMIMKIIFIIITGVHPVKAKKYRMLPVHPSRLNQKGRAQSGPALH